MIAMHLLESRLGIDALPPSTSSLDLAHSQPPVGASARDSAFSGDQTTGQWSICSYQDKV